MVLFFRLGGVGFRLCADFELPSSAALLPFSEPDGACDCRIELTLSDRLPDDLPDPCPPRQGQELFETDDGLLCVTARSGQRWGVARCAPDFSVIRLTASAANADLTALYLFHYLPLPSLFAGFGALLLHAAQIDVAGRGVLFTAPSGTGKTTQATLWQAERGARPICNDRVLLHRSGRVWLAYGFPFDGSAPIRSAERLPAACLVALRQAPENRVERLHPARALAFLMQQSAIDPSCKGNVLELLLSLVEELPVYLLSCTADARAVTCLERRLLTDGVL